MCAFVKSHNAPLSHAAALSKAHGNRKLADKLVPGAGRHGLNPHGVQTEISRGDLRRSGTIDAHHARGGKVSLHDQKSGETVSIRESHAATLHNQGHTITGVSGGNVVTRSDYGTAHIYNPQTGRSVERKAEKNPMNRMVDGTTWRETPAGIIAVRGNREVHLLGTSVVAQKKAREMLAKHSFDKLFKAGRKAPGAKHAAFHKLT